MTEATKPKHHKMGLPFLAVIAIVLTLMASTASAEKDGKMWVNITNRVGGAFTVQCASRDDNLGSRVLPNGQSYYFDFFQNIWGSTLFWCNFTWQQRTAHVVVWKGPGFGGFHYFPCDYCVWVVMPEGFYRAQDGNTPMFIQGWEYP